MSKKQRMTLFVFAAAAVFAVTYLLVLPAFTLDEEEAIEQGGIDVPAELSFEGDGYNIALDADAKAGLPEGTQVSAEEVTPDAGDYDAWCDETLKALQEAGQAEDNTTISSARFYDISLLADGEAIEPKSAVGVRISYDKAIRMKSSEGLRVVHFAADENGGLQPEVLDEDNVDINAEDGSGTVKVSDVAFQADGFSMYAIVGTESLTTSYIAAEGDTYSITVTYGPEADIPDGSELEVSEIMYGTDSYNEYYEQAVNTVNGDGTVDPVDISSARFFDVSIISDGKKIEPKAEVTVKIDYNEPFTVDDPEDLKVIHFADTGTELIDVDNTETNISEVVYSQNGFSVIGTIAITNASGWPTSNGQYVLMLKNGDDYYAVSHDGTLKRVKYFNETVSFVGPGTTDVSYIDEYLWYLRSSGSRTRAYISAEEYSGSGSGAGITFINPRVEAGIAEGSAINLQIRDGKIYSQTSQTDVWTLSAEAGDGGKVKRVGLYDDEACEVFFAERSSFTANDNESEMFNQVDIEALIEKWRRQMTQDLSVDKTAEVYDYDNRIYRVDIEASSGYYEISPSIALEFVVDCSRSMYFPARLEEVGSFTTTSAKDDTEANGIRNWIRDNGQEDQVYYFITDPNSSADVYAIWHDEKGWCFGNSSYYHTKDSTVLGMRGGIYGHLFDKRNYVPDPCQDSDLGAGRHPDDLTVLNARSFDGKIYKSDAVVVGQPWNRLDYLTLAVEAAAKVVYAVDADAQIGLTKFASANATQHLGTWGKDQQEEFYRALNDLSVIGGTNHEAGLNEAIEALSNETQHQHSVVLVTDGAPTNETNWDKISEAAATLRNQQSVNRYTTLYTLGLSLENVGTNKESLFSIAGYGPQAGDPKYQYDAESGEEIVNCISQIVEDVVIEANLIGNVTDVVDKAFYPVDKTTGRPLEAGDWITIDGEKTTPGAADAVGKITNAAGVWSVEWKDQHIDWPNKDSSGTIIDPGWHGTIYVKAKEDFLGGNGINTNTAGSKVEATQYVDHSGNPVDLETDEESRVKDLDTPYVNVDELAFSEESSEWTVYLGTDVDPLSEIKQFWSDIKVREVVSNSTEDQRIASDGNLVYPLEADSVEDGRAEVNPREEIALSELVDLTEDQWNDLISNKTIDIPYNAYDHQEVGTIRISLASDVVTGEKDLSESPHDTTVVASPAEKYTLTVTYIPSDAEISDYHTGTYGTKRPGSDTNDIESENVHKINVFAKGMQITKMDQTFSKELEGAKFVLYRTAREGDDPSKVTTISGASGNYYPVAELDMSSQTAGTIDPIRALKSGEQYYLVETEAPAGYYVLDHPLPVEISITDSYVPKPGTDSQTTKPEGRIYDWTQSATLSLGNGDGAVKQTDADNENDLTNTGVVADSENAILYFRIANSAGIELPSSGGPGTTWIYLIGTILLLGCGITLIARRRIRA